MAVLAFGAGVRMCPGEKMALSEGAIILSAILSQFGRLTLDPSKKQTIQQELDLTMHATHLTMQFFEEK